MPFPQQSPSSDVYFCICMVCTGGRFSLVENVTEEVQSLRNRVELLEKVREKIHKHTFQHKRIKATYPDTLRHRSPWTPLVLFCLYDVKPLLIFNPQTKDSLKRQTCFLQFVWSFIKIPPVFGETSIKGKWSGIMFVYQVTVLFWSSLLFSLTPSPLPHSAQKLQLVLAPFNSFFPLSLDEGISEKTTLLSHSFQQLDRIDSLSEQIGFLEERLGTCEWPRVDRWLYTAEDVALRRRENPAFGRTP